MVPSFLITVRISVYVAVSFNCFLVVFEIEVWQLQLMKMWWRIGTKFCGNVLREEMPLLATLIY